MKEQVLQLVYSISKSCSRNICKAEFELIKIILNTKVYFFMKLIIKLHQAELLSFLFLLSLQPLRVNHSFVDFFGLTSAMGLLVPLLFFHKNGFGIN